ncbi:hypothetical protein BD626DRAFT_525799 [Schizophyllum amplum]|uniref:Uncharacterized protein n=1 Tax=Schizophyllum amplum TaxID=97359 RepID=A0A550BSE9_9AGAR|nr:hypothetical protein BD626DRAFT_525799 [Auriculariopsis ampla]
MCSCSASPMSPSTSQRSAHRRLGRNLLYAWWLHPLLRCYDARPSTIRAGQRLREDSGVPACACAPCTETFGCVRAEGGWLLALLVAYNSTLICGGRRTVDRTATPRITASPRLTGALRRARRSSQGTAVCSRGPASSWIPNVGDGPRPYGPHCAVPAVATLASPQSLLSGLHDDGREV